MISKEGMKHSSNHLPTFSIYCKPSNFFSKDSIFFSISIICSCVSLILEFFTASSCLCIDNRSTIVNFSDSICGNFSLVYTKIPVSGSLLVSHQFPYPIRSLFFGWILSVQQSFLLTVPTIDYQDIFSPSYPSDIWLLYSGNFRTGSWHLRVIPVSLI